MSECECVNAKYIFSMCEEPYYRYKDNIYCGACLLEKLEENKTIKVSRAKVYFSEIWDKIGNDEDMSEYELIQEITHKLNLHITEIED